MLKTDSKPTIKLLHGLIEENKIAEFENLPELWVFGYGSLVWLPNFAFTEKVTGYICGYDRRFYQSNVTHRGNTSLPGRVATLLPSTNQNARTYGVAFRLVGQSEIAAALLHLNMRESTLGGYILKADLVSTKNGQIPAVFYVATAENDQYTGVESLEKLASIIAVAKGPSGPNTDYLFNLATWQHKNCPEVIDDHLYGLEKLTKMALFDRKTQKDSLMAKRAYLGMMWYNFVPDNNIRPRRTRG